MKRFTMFMALFLTANISVADVIVEVHGYLGSAISWERSGVNALLSENNWQRVGVLNAQREGVVLYRDQFFQDATTKKLIYNTNLPSQAPLLVQADYLVEMLKWINTTYPEENIIIIGHSAGGVVARIALLNEKVKNITTLITIASPHMGTYRAAEALDFSDDGFPINIIKDFMTGGLHSTLRQSTGLLYDLLPPRQGSILALLNNEKHPDIRYVSVVRTLPIGLTGDAMVPGLSQNMNSIPVLRGKSEVIYSKADHELVIQDAWTVLDILGH